MANKDVYISGKAKWVKAHAPDKFGKWSVVVYPDSASLVKIEELKKGGIKNVLKKDDDGYYMAFSRPTQRMIRGKVVGFAPPIITDKEGVPLEGVLVGNGSDVTLKLETYGGNHITSGKWLAARWAALRVDSLIPFTGKRDFDEEQTKQVNGLDEQPEPLF